jgi:hypothetical protein
VEEESMRMDIDKVLDPPKPMLEVDEAFWEQMENTESRRSGTGSWNTTE